VHDSVKLPERGIETCFAGEASPRSPELTTPPEYVDRVIRSTTFRFLVHTVTTLPREAHRALGLNQIAVVWPVHSLPTRTPACARGPDDSGHSRRRAAPRCDRQSLNRASPALRRTYLAAGKPRHPFLSRGYCLHWGKDLGEEEGKVRGLFEPSATQGNSGAGVDLCGLI
jgi:hypothetical protein